MQDLMRKLRAANDARHKVWPGATNVDLAFATIEFGGEAGEAVEAFDAASDHCESECGSTSSVPLSPEIRRVNESSSHQHQQQQHQLHHQEPSLLTLYHSAR